MWINVTENISTLNWTDSWWFIALQLTLILCLTFSARIYKKRNHMSAQARKARILCYLVFECYFTFKLIGHLGKESNTLVWKYRKEWFMLTQNDQSVNKTKDNWLFEAQRGPRVQSWHVFGCPLPIFHLCKRTRRLIRETNRVEIVCLEIMDINTLIYLWIMCKCHYTVGKGELGKMKH